MPNNKLAHSIQLYSNILYKEKINALLPALTTQGGKELNGDDMQQVWYPYGR